MQTRGNILEAELKNQKKKIEEKSYFLSRNKINRIERLRDISEK